MEAPRRRAKSSRRRNRCKSLGVLPVCRTYGMPGAKGASQTDEEAAGEICSACAGHDHGSRLSPAPDGADGSGQRPQHHSARRRRTDPARRRVQRAPARRRQRRRQGQQAAQGADRQARSGHGRDCRRRRSLCEQAGGKRFRTNPWPRYGSRVHPVPDRAALIPTLQWPTGDASCCFF